MYFRSETLAVLCHQIFVLSLHRYLPSLFFDIIPFYDQLSQGEYIAAENIEGKILARVPFIQQLLVHGDSTESCLVAIIVPEPDTFVPFVNKVLSGVNLALEDVAEYKRICSDPKLRQSVLQELNKAAKDIGLRGYVLLAIIGFLCSFFSCSCMM